MKIETNKKFIKCASQEEEDLTKNIFMLIIELKASLEEKDYVFYRNYFYKKPNGTKVYLCKMDERYRRNALKYFKRIDTERAFFSSNHEDYECDYSRDVWLG